MEQKRTSVGLFVGNIMDTFSNLVCKGAIKAAEEMDVNLVIFPGNYLDFNRADDTGVAFEYQSNVLFSYANKCGVDVLLACIGSIGCFTTRERRKQLLDAVGVPVITIASNESYPSVAYDNYGGLKDAIEYLIEQQGKTRIAMLAGPKSNDDFAERLFTFSAIMEEHGLPVSEDMIAFGDASRYSTAQVEELLDKNPDLDAIVCGNDDMALAVYEVCMRREITIGKDLLVVGFDDVEAASKLSPPLSSVRADAASLGYRALIEGLRLLRGGEKRNEIIPTKFIPRESVAYIGEDIDELVRIAFLHASTDETIARLANAITDYVFYMDVLNVKTYCFKENITKLITLYSKAEETSADAEDIIDVIDECFSNLIHNGYIEYADQHRIISLYTVALKQLQKSTRGEIYTNIMSTVLAKQLKFLSDAMLYRSTAKMKQNAAIMHSTNMLCREMLMSDNMGEQPYYTVISKMQMLDIERSCLFIYEQPQKFSFGAEWKQPEHILMKAYQIDDKATAIPRTKQKMLTRNLFESGFFNTQERHTWVLHDLFSRELQFGVFICDLRYDMFNLAELLTYQISTAVKMLNLFQNERTAQRKLEETLEQLTLNNITLDRMSRFDELTGILNRRGFMEQGNDMLKGADGKTMIIVYADLDSLKLINDTFGHDEGDYALKAATEILSLTFYQRGILGRIGGDEFAAMMPKTEENIREKVFHDIQRNMDDFNAGVDKKYRIQISVGIDEIKYTKGMQLTDMLCQADDLLYRSKKHKKSILNDNTPKPISKDEVERMIKDLMKNE